MAFSPEKGITVACSEIALTYEPESVGDQTFSHLAYCGRRSNQRCAPFTAGICQGPDGKGLKHTLVVADLESRSLIARALHQRLGNVTLKKA